jgi:predicted transcriptional regulator
MPAPTTLIAARLPNELLAQLDAIAESEHRNRTSQLIHGLSVYLESLQGKTRGEIENTTPEPIAPMSAKRTNKRI